jgi:hypothetical protein
MPQTTGGGVGGDDSVFPGGDFWTWFMNYLGDAATNWQAIWEQAGLAEGEGDVPPTFPPGFPGFPGSGGGGMTAGMTANLRSSFLEVLRSWGIGITPNLDKLVNRGVNAQWSTTTFLQYLRKTNEYGEQFPGIQWKRGMTEATYNMQFDAYFNLGQDVGYKLDRDAFGFLLKKGVEPTEYQARIQAIDRIDQYRPLFNQFEEVLRLRGLLRPKEQLKKKDLADFVMGVGSKQWEAVWEEASFSEGLENAGFFIQTKGGKKFVGNEEFGIGRKALLRTIRAIESTGVQVESATTQDFVELAALVETAFPLSQIYKSGIKKTDLIQLKFGGPKAPQVALRVQRLLNTHAAFEDEERATGQLLPSAEGGTQFFGGATTPQQSE